MTEVLVTGCFGRGLHPGHIELFEYASEFGLLTVGINDDKYTEKRYGLNSIKAEHKKYMIESIKWVKNVIIFNEEEPSNLIKLLKPKYYVKGPDYKNKILIEEIALKETNTKLIICPKFKIYNNSKLT